MRKIAKKELPSKLPQDTNVQGKFRGQTICVNAHLRREEFHGQCVKICVCVQNCYCFLGIHSLYLYLTHYHFLL